MQEAPVKCLPGLGSGVATPAAPRVYQFEARHRGAHKGLNYPEVTGPLSKTGGDLGVVPSKLLTEVCDVRIHPKS